MHPVLLIDEIFQVILEHCSEWQTEDYRFILCQLARCCRAWQDPVTDRLWRRLESAEPLLRLISVMGGDVGECSPVDAASKSQATFSYYADKVRHVSFNAAPYGIVAASGPPLSNITSVALSRDGCLTSARWIQSTKLREVDVDMRTASDDEATRRRAANIAHILDQNHAQQKLHRLKIRGWMTPVLEHSVTSLTSLRNLVLHTGKSLTPQALASLSAFPDLEQLSVHASHIDADDFASAIPTSPITFPALHTLRLRGQRSLFCAVLGALPRGNLRSLYLETEEPEQGVTAWRETFDLIVAKATDTLIDFTLDQILEPEEMEDTMAHAESDTRLAVETLQPLSGLRTLRRFTIDAMILPDFTNKDIDRIASWWPLLEQLNLGTLPGMQEYAQPWIPKITIAALTSLAKRCPHLESLTLPLDISSPPPKPQDDNKSPVIRQDALRKLYVGHAGISDGIPAFLRGVLEIYPKLQDLECITMEKSVSLDVQASLQEQRLPEDRGAGTSDGYASGQ